MKKLTGSGFIILALISAILTILQVAGVIHICWYIIILPVALILAIVIILIIVGAFIWHRENKHFNYLKKK